MVLAKIRNGIAGALPALIRDACGVAGVVLLSYGAWLVYAPAGFITGGVLLLAGAVLLARSGP
jgi:hypothetical protein